MPDFSAVMKTVHTVESEVHGGSFEQALHRCSVRNTVHEVLELHKCSTRNIQRQSVPGGT